MEGSGTDYDYRIKRLEEGQEKLSNIATDLHHIVTRLDERTEKHTETFEELKQSQREQANNKPTLLALAAVIIPSLSIFAAAGLMLIEPVDQRSKSNMDDLKQIQRTRFTRDDYNRANDLIRIEMQSEFKDMREWQHIQDRRIDELSRNQ